MPLSLSSNLLNWLGAGPRDEENEAVERDSVVVEAGRVVGIAVVADGTAVDVDVDVADANTDDRIERGWVVPGDGVVDSDGTVGRLW